MLYLMTNRINIIIIILLTIKIISLKANESLNGNFTVIEFLKELEHSKPTYDNILIIQNQNATISSIFHTHLIKMLNSKNNNGTTLGNRQGGCFAGPLCEMAATTTFVKSLMDGLQVPVLQLNELQSFYLKRQYNEHFLSIVYIDINIEGIQMTLNDHKGLLEKLSGNLLHMTTSKVMFLLNFPLVVKEDCDSGAAVATSAIDEDVIQGILVKLFHHSWQQKIINVVALRADYQTTSEFFTYTHFPNFQLEIKAITSNPKEQPAAYPYRLGDLKGYKVPIVKGNKIPRIIRYNTSKGREIMGGFVGHFMRAFAKKYKCTLVQPVLSNANEVPKTEEDLESLVRTAQVEISLGITPLQNIRTASTYPIYILDWCIMLPVEANIPAYKFFTAVFKGETYLLVIGVIIVLSILLSAALYVHGRRVDCLDIFCHGNCLRGILSQTFSEITNPPILIRFIYLKICITGLLLTTSYLSYFSTYVTRPPQEPLLETFDDVLRSDLKIALWEYEYKYLLQMPEYQKYQSIFHVVKTYQEFLNLRSSFNRKYAYGVSNLQWDIIKEQQKIFTTLLFRQSSKFCIINTIPMCFPVQENSIYAELLHKLILETAQSGLLAYWINCGFRELIAAKKLKLEDLSANVEFKAMTIDDLRYVLMFLAGMFVFVNFLFLAELLIYYRRRIFDSYANFICKIKL